MTKISHRGYRFPPEIIRRAIWLCYRFTLSFRDVEDLLAERGVVVSYETIRRWATHFGPKIAADLRRRRPRPHTTWHLDEVYLTIDGRMVYLWRAVDAEGEVLDVLVQSRRNKRAPLKLMRKLLKKYAFVPDRLVTDDLRSYAPAVRDLGLTPRHDRGRRRNNRAENSHQPTRRRERTMQEFKSAGGRLEGNGAHGYRIEMAVHFENQSFRPVPFDDQSGVNRWRRLPLEGHVDHGASNRSDDARRRYRSHGSLRGGRLDCSWTDQLSAPNRLSLDSYQGAATRQFKAS
jgi:transposase-like protein